MSVTKRPDGRWRGRYRDPAGKEHAAHFARRVDAERWVTANKSRRDRGEWLDPELGRVSVGAIAPTWLAAKQLKPSSQRSYESLWRTVVEPRWGRTSLKGITYAQVVAWVRELTDNGMSASRVSQALLVLKQILDLAVLDGRLSRNAAKQVPGPRPRQTKQRYLSHADVHRLAEECGHRDTRHKVLVLTLAYTGIRWGEARALRLRHFDAAQSLLRIIDNIPVGFGEDQTVKPKSNRVRVVPLPAFLRNLLIAVTRGLRDDDLIFTSRSATLLNNSNFRRDVFDPAVERLRLRPLTPHDLRHTAASLAISAGASVVGVQTMLGHATPAITLSVYTHLFPDDLQSVAAKLDRAAQDALTGQSLGRIGDATTDSSGTA